MAGRQQFPKTVGDTIYKEDVLPDRTVTTTIVVDTSHYKLDSSRKGTIIRATDCVVPADKAEFIYTAGSGSVVVPVFASIMTITAVGGGGGAGGGSEQDPYVTGGGGGGSGGLIIQSISVSPGAIVYWKVGAGGAGYHGIGNASGKPQDGSDTSVTYSGITYISPGGKSAQSAHWGHYNLGGSAGNSNGVSGSNGAYSGVGGTGGAIIGYGVGGLGANVHLYNGGNGSGYGAGGGGGVGFEASGTPNLGNGGNGSGGYIKIQFS